jgi:hypothetical protein
MNPVHDYRYSTLSRFFPFRLHALLDHESDVPIGIAWSPSGDSFRIISKKDICETMRVYFNRKPNLAIL